MRKEEFVEKAIAKHGHAYGYSKVNYIDCKTKIEIVCLKHGSFWQSPESHYKGAGCPICARSKRNLNKKHTPDIFITKAKIVHGDKYNYNLTKYCSRVTKVEIICPLHGVFEQQAGSHLDGCGCPKCSGNSKLSFEDFVEKSNRVHRNKYTYSQPCFVNTVTKTTIVCPFHGPFKQTPFDHYSNKQGCPLCSGNLLWTIDQFIEKAVSVHGNKYDYSKAHYINAHKKLEIVCSQHGSFWQTTDNHLNGKQGCPKCNFSKGEKRIAELLDVYGINYKTEYRFPDCRYKKPLPFDFAIFNKANNLYLLIEFDGLQHYQKVKSYKTSDGDLTLRREKDNIKTNYCIEKGINLLRIPYWEYDNIDRILTNELHIRRN